MSVLSLPKHTQFLQLQHFNEITRLPKLSLNDLTDLRALEILFCYSIEFMVPKDEEGIFLRRMEKMRFNSCQDLRKIYEKVPAQGAFPCLKRLAIRNCHSIKKLFSTRLLQMLHNLEEIEAGNCEQLEELVIADGDESGEGSCNSTLHNSDIIPVLPRLYKLWLRGLPKLKNTWSRILMHNNSWKSVTFQSLNQLDSLFSMSLLQQHFQNLKEIVVADCTELEELIVEEPGEGRNNSNNTSTHIIDNTITLPKLKTLEFERIPKLKSIWKGVMVCDSLQTVEVIGCPELKKLPLFNEEHQSTPPSLKKI